MGRRLTNQGRRPKTFSLSKPLTDMINETFHKDGKTFLQVNKRTARKYFENGARIYLLPCNLRFNNCWQTPCPIRETIGGDFDNQCVDFMYYNCDNERGRYIHYFVELNKQ